MRLYFLLARRVPPVLSPVLREVFQRLEAQGFQIESGIAEEVLTRPDRLSPQHDLYVLKSHTELALSLAGVLHAQGARLLNPYPSWIATQNKIVASRLLRAAGVPAPDVWVTGDLALLRDVARSRPLIIKPYLGQRGAGLRIVRDPADLAALPPPDSPVVVQEYIEGSPEDLKVYVVGDHVAAVRKPFSQDSFTRPGRPGSVSPEVRDIALRCGRVFGLGLYGLDVIESPQGPWVVDVNTFPGYKGVPDAPRLIADYIRDAAQRAARGEPVVAFESPAVGPLVTERAFRGSALQLVLNGLSTTPATQAELDEIDALLDLLRKLIDEKRGPAESGITGWAES
jgi:ribosomal protein S6--L-glutamate ligase